MVKRLLSNPIITGTFFLTLAGLATKFMGFFYRIFISRIFTEEALGIFGLIAPVMMLANSLCSAGIQSSITRFVAASKGNDKGKGAGYLFAGLFISILLSSIITVVIFKNSLFIAVNIIGERRCAPLLKLCALSFPLASVHSCINGYYYGLKKASVPSFSIVIEQAVRVATVFLLYRITLQYGANVSLSYLCIGMVMGEFASAVFSIIALTVSSSLRGNGSFTLSAKTCGSIITLALPISMNRIFIGLMSSYETIQLPKKLVESGLSSSQALSVYGVFSGMAIPLIMFPNALTGSVASLLLPSVSEDEAKGNSKHIRKTIITSSLFCFMVGMFCFLFFFVFANLIGDWLFKSDLAASQIRSLSFICPFMYISGALSSILHGLGRTLSSFIFNFISTLARIGFIMFVVPNVGFSGYIYGHLFSIILLDLLILLALRRYIIYN
jgi:stage V sporulation protein B